MKRILLIIAFISTPCFAEDFIVSGNEVFKVVQTTKDEELVSLNEKKSVLEREISNLEANANDYQSKADELKPELIEVERRIKVLTEPEEIEENIEVDSAIYN